MVPAGAELAAFAHQIGQAGMHGRLQRARLDRLGQRHGLTGPVERYIVGMKFRQQQGGLALQPAVATSSRQTYGLHGELLGQHHLAAVTCAARVVPDGFGLVVAVTGFLCR